MDVARKTHDQAIAAAKADFEKAKLDIKTTPVLGAIDAERVKLALEEAEAQYKQVLAEEKYFDIGQNAHLRNAELDLQQAKIELKRAEANADRMLMKAAIGGLTVMQNSSAVPRCADPGRRSALPGPALHADCGHAVPW